MRAKLQTQAVRRVFFFRRDVDIVRQKIKTMSILEIDINDVLRQYVCTPLPATRYGDVHTPTSTSVGLNRLHVLSPWGGYAQRNTTDKKKKSEIQIKTGNIKRHTAGTCIYVWEYVSYIVRVCYIFRIVRPLEWRTFSRRSSLKEHHCIKYVL